MNLVRNLSVQVKTEDVLKALRENVEKHKTIIAEARKGYVEKSKELLQEKLEKLANGEIVSLSFDLRPPVDYTNVYETAIKMMELHTGEDIELDGSQVRQLLMDEWDWMNSFLAENRRFSETAMIYSKSKGF